MTSLIVIPTYNRAHQLGRAIEAALGQSQGDVRVLVVDDGSTDDTAALLARHAGHPRFGSIRLEANVGTAGAKNVALALCPFDAVTFHDSDDVPHVDKLLRQQRTLLRDDLVADPCLPWGLTGGDQAPGARAPIDLVLTAHRFVMADGSASRIARTLSLVDDFFPGLQFATGPLGDWVLINSGLWSRRLIARIGGYADSVEEDRDIRNRALMHGANIWFLDDVLLTKYEEADSLTAMGATGYRSDRRLADRQAVWATIGAWRQGGAAPVVPIAIRDVGLAAISRPDWFAVAGDLPMDRATRDWLQRALGAARG